MILLDAQSRRINYLRLSITDRCNLRCRYCMPAEGISKVSKILCFEDLLRLARIAISIGLDKVRVTGGEPLVRKGVIKFLERLSALDGLSELVLTTNGVLLREMAGSLRRAGVQRLNISLDSLKPDVFAQITRGGRLQDVLDGLAASEEARFPPPKINVLVMRGVNDGEVLDFAALSVRKSYAVRFIEYMPTMIDPDWRSRWVPGDEVLKRIQSKYPLRPIIRHADSAGPARNFQIAGAPGTIGIINPISHRFCQQCNRIRITATGLAKGCLFAPEATDLKPLLGAEDEILRQTLRAMVASKPARHGLSGSTLPRQPFSMAQIGG